jgi:hypothetical protein
MSPAAPAIVFANAAEELGPTDDARLSVPLEREIRAIYERSRFMARGSRCRPNRCSGRATAKSQS